MSIGAMSVILDLSKNYFLGESYSNYFWNQQKICFYRFKLVKFKNKMEDGRKIIKFSF